jgi:hypothetical protein
MIDHCPGLLTVAHGLLVLPGPQDHAVHHIGIDTGPLRQGVKERHDLFGGVHVPDAIGQIYLAGTQARDFNAHGHSPLCGVWAVVDIRCDRDDALGG